MLLLINKLFFAFSFNISLFLILMIGIQNSINKKQVNLIINETVNLPISFIVGFSFISGSTVGSLISLNFKEKKD